MSDSEQRIEITESTIAKIASNLATLAPIGLAVLQYVNDPTNMVGILICLLLLVVVVLWRQTQATVRELKAEVLLLRGLIVKQQDQHAKYKQISNNTIVNMFAWFNRLAGERDAGSIQLDGETGASVYLPPPPVVSPLLRRATDKSSEVPEVPA